MLFGALTCSAAEAAKHVVEYAENYDKTLTWFDRVGSPPDPSPNEITLADLARITAINARLRAGNINTLMTRKKASSLLAQVPTDTALTEITPEDTVWSKASELYEAFRVSGIGQARRSKLLHLKRPHLIPIWDSRVQRAYPRRLFGAAGGRWARVREDMLANSADNIHVRDLLHDRASDGSIPAARSASLTDLRLHDIVAWSLTAP